MELSELQNELPFGPKMAALTEKQRRYVLAMLSAPLGNPTEWARAAGYVDGGPQSSLIRKTAHHLSHDERLKDAAQEEARRHLDTVGPVLAVGVMLQIARDGKHKKQLEAAMALADRAGFHAKSEHKVSVSHSLDVEQLEEFARRLALENGIDPARFIGVGQVIEGEATEVADGQ